MYHLLSRYFSASQLAMLGIIFTFLLTFFALKHPFPFLPSDHGRDFAVNGSLSRGKIRGVGLTFVICFLIGGLLFLPLDGEMAVYGILLVCIMLSGYLDDASDTPWSDYKKGAIDLVLSVVTMLTFLNYNSTTILLGTYELTIPKAVYLVLGIILIWISINVTNCSDGVDGLCASLCTVVIFSFSIIFREQLGSYTVANELLAAALLAYLYFNTSPSSMLMGDAGSRALGFYIAVIAMKSSHPFLYLLLAGVLIVDGGLGLVKIFLKRFLKISILKNTRTPLHDHMRLKYKWSDTQVVNRFVILQILLAIIACLVIL
ncbi:MAG: phospho-N-acetylmuramoyl-pentapeptide-transferase [Fusicatenibacter sp.]|nr:phospho-N-acetylmuramoyl-pentapeptide-transferase [Lachnospiraceae bacterium]MDY2936731.1 phospho-N-acetylmuramoyl-pentapeptide-transferase [Fusicatenibacter sp.]